MREKGIADGEAKGSEDSKGTKVQTLMLNGGVGHSALPKECVGEKYIFKKTIAKRGFAALQRYFYGKGVP